MRLAVLVSLTLLGAAPADPGWLPSRQHRSSEADAGRGPCHVPIRLVGIQVANPDAGPAYPQWVPVEDETPAILEGTVVAKSDAPGSGPHTAVDDMPTSHDTHDLCFPVLPDPTPDGRFTNLLGIRVHAGGREGLQRTIGIEWESGLGADNDGNLAAGPGRRGDSFGYYSAGHRRGEVLWNWPTEGDRVHIEGRWVWDRGHPPYKTEIHPARLVAVLRKLPDAGAPGGEIATRADVFASGAGGALWNYRPDAPAFVDRPRMGQRDYEFHMPMRQARPSPEAQLAWQVRNRPGDSFPAPLDVVPEGDGLRVRIPWQSQNAPDSAIVARTLLAWWVGPGPRPAARRLRVTLDEIEIRKTHDLGNGEYRVFADVAGNWVFLNEFLPVRDVLREGLGNTAAPATFKIGQAFQLAVPEGETFRVYADGWEADGVNALFGRLIDPHHACDGEFRELLTTGLYTLLAGGGRDDGIGGTRALYGPENAWGVGDHADRSWARSDRDEEERYEDVWTGEDTDPDGSFVLRYRIAE